MDKFNKTLRGYNIDEVNNFLDKIIKKVEAMVLEINNKNIKIKQLEEQVEHYKAMEKTLSRSIIVAEETGAQIKKNAREERDLLIKDARRNADRIINESLIRAEKINYKTAVTKKNVVIYKRRLKNLIESQLDMVEDIDIEDTGLDI